MSYKANALADELVSVLSVRLSGAPSTWSAGAQANAVTVAKAFDADGQPMIKIGTQAAGSKSATIKIAETTATSAMPANSLGMPQSQYSSIFTPHVAQFIIEGINTTTNAVAASTYGQFPILGGTTAVFDWTLLMYTIAELLARGCRTELYTTAYGTAPTIANKPATPVAVFDSLYNPLTSSM